jgi:aspartyl-tRNA(Asn)/glutamyl-tRNA(Gln) amidotransferase subunit A
MTDLTSLTLAEASARLQERTVSAVELMEATLRRIEATEPLIHAFAWRDGDAAMDAARKCDVTRMNGSAHGMLHGIPIGVKDLLYTKDIPTEAGSRVLEGFRPAHDATVVRKLRDAGAIIVGKTVTHEFAYGQNVPETRNPWQLDSYPGGSSAGSGAAVAARSLFAAIGTDTGGSVRTPSAVNGIVGLKPTYGLVSRHGCVPMSTSLDHIGPMTRTVLDTAILLAAIVGFDANDPASLRSPAVDYHSELDAGIRGMRIGIDTGYFLYDKVQAPVRKAVETAIELLVSLGAERIEVSIPELEWSTTVGNVTTEVDMSAWHRRLLRSKRGHYDPGTRLMLELGELIPASHYVLAQQVRTRIRGAVRRTFAEHRLDALLGPTIPVTAPRLDELSVDLVDEVAEGGLSTLVHHEYPANITGLPALSVPCGFSEAGLPIGFQVIGQPLHERTLLRLGYAYQAATAWHTRQPDLSTVGPMAGAR